MRLPWVVFGGIGLLAAIVAGGVEPPSFTPWTKTNIGMVLRHAATPEKHQIETMAGGVAVIDFDSDGRMDLFFANGARQPALRKIDSEYWNRLYRNRGDGSFEDVTERAGVRGEGYSVGAAVADFDNDGRPDLFVAGVERNILYRNRGDGVFDDVTARARIPHRGWAVGGGWSDYDSDGDLDLFIVNYVRFDPSQEPYCGDATRGLRTYCHPKFYEGLPNTLLRNNGDLTFTDVSAESGIARHLGKGMAVAFADYDSDGRPDAFVTNDTTPNFLFHNQGGGRFREVAGEAGVAYNDDGRALSSMGADFRDIDNDGRDDLFVTALANETFPFYRNLGGGLFGDETYPSRIGAATLALSGWSTGIFDFDNDGRKDIFTANGDVNDNTELFSSRKSAQACVMLWNRGKTFSPEEVSLPAQYRGAAFADFDGDGRLDVVVTRLGGQPTLLGNRAGAENHWLALQLEGSRSNRDGMGARVSLLQAAGREQWNHATTAVGYASASERLVRFGLGNETVARRIEVRWPSGVVQVLTDVKADQILAVREPIAAPPK